MTSTNGGSTGPSLNGASTALSTMRRLTCCGVKSEQVCISSFSSGVALTICNNSAFKNFAGGYQGSIKQPDHFLRVDSDPEPRIVVESGWGKTFPHLRSDKNVWLEGHVSVILVILLKWSALSNNRIKGTAEIWRRDGAGNLVSSAMVIIYLPSTTQFSTRN